MHHSDDDVKGMGGGSKKLKKAASKAAKATVKAEKEFDNMKQAHKLFVNLAKQTKNGGKKSRGKKTKKGGKKSKKSGTKKRKH